MAGCEEEPLSLSPRSNGTNTRTSHTARSREVPGLRMFPSQAAIFCVHQLQYILIIKIY